MTRNLQDRASVPTTEAVTTPAAMVRRAIALENEAEVHCEDEFSWDDLSRLGQLKSLAMGAFYEERDALLARACTVQGATVDDALHQLLAALHHSLHIDDEGDSVAACEASARLIFAAVWSALEVLQKAHGVTIRHDGVGFAHDRMNPWKEPDKEEGGAS